VRASGVSRLLLAACVAAGLGTPCPASGSDAPAPARRGGPLTDPPGPLVGVKIYEPVADTGALLGEWSRLGIDTAFVAPAFESGDFVAAARRRGIRTLLIVPVFYNPEYLAAHPDAWAITGRGERAKQEWVEFVCPSREDYRQRRLEEAVGLLEKHRPDGLSLDFVRHFVFWEKVGPEARIGPLDTTCFCRHCLARFERDTGVAVPGDAGATTTDAARWLLANETDAWTRWRAALVTSWVSDLVREARRVEPDVVVGAHLVPWGRRDYDDGLLRVAGQDVEALGRLLDYVSPMCYAHMLRREPSWIARVAEEFARRTDVPVLPSIEVARSYREEELDDAFFAAALRAALAPPSDGVVLWSWPRLAESPSRREILLRRGR